MGETDFVGIKDASLHGISGIIVSHRQECKPMVFRMEWPQDTTQAVLHTNAKQGGHLTNSDLEMVGLLVLWLIMEDVCDLTQGTHGTSLVTIYQRRAGYIAWQPEGQRLHAN
jgi:hypothetical protein